MLRFAFQHLQKNIAMNGDFEYYKHQRPEVADLLPDTYQHVLEVGCGEGVFRRNLTKACEYTGIEPSPTAAATARTTLDRVLTGTYDTVASDLPVDYFDLVICNDVIEHMVDHDKFLEDIKRHMKTGAIMVGSVPNVRYFFHLWDLLVGKDWRYIDQGILDRTHLRFFTQKSWRDSLSTHGYSIEILQGINQPAWGERMLRRWAKLILASVIGADSKFMQIAFRAKLLSRH